MKKNDEMNNALMNQATAVIDEKQRKIVELTVKRDAFLEELGKVETERDALGAEKLEDSKQICELAQCLLTLKEDFAALLKERDALRGALEFYADPINYDNGAPAILVNIGGDDFLEHDEGKIARTALKPDIPSDIKPIDSPQETKG